MLTRPSSARRPARFRRLSTLLAMASSLSLFSGCASDQVVTTPISPATAPSLTQGRPASYPERLNREIDQMMAGNPSLTRQEAYQRAERSVRKTASDRGNEPAYGKELDVMDW